MRLGVCIPIARMYMINYTKPKLGIEKITNKFKSFDIEFLPFIEEINAKEGVIRKFADAATMERIRGIILLRTYDFEYNYVKI